MAKQLLWIFVLINMISLIIFYINDTKPSEVMVVMLWSVLSVIAICESIEKVGK